MFLIIPGRVKVKSYDAKGVSSLKAQWIPRVRIILIEIFKSVLL